jgi:riboflavin-specific deaminase-like protein
MSNIAVEEHSTLRPLLPPGPPATAAQIAQALDFTAARSRTPQAPEETISRAAGEPARAETALGAVAGAAPLARPHVLLNMVATVDGRATLAGRSAAIGNSADRELFHALRGVVDGVLVGAGTARAERYRRLIREPARREQRRARGLAEEPLACIVSRRLALTPPEIPLLDDPDARLAILTSSRASLGEHRAQVQYVRAERDGQLDLAAALGELHERFGVRTLLCEGGPHLNAQLLASGLVDELFFSLSPLLAGGEASAEALRIVTGVDLDPPVELQLLSAFENRSHLFLRYGVRGPRAPRSTGAPVA